MRIQSLLIHPINVIWQMKPFLGNIKVNRLFLYLLIVVKLMRVHYRKHMWRESLMAIFLDVTFIFFHLAAFSVKPAATSLIWEEDYLCCEVNWSDLNTWHFATKSKCTQNSNPRICCERTKKIFSWLIRSLAIALHFPPFFALLNNFYDNTDSAWQQWGRLLIGPLHIH